MRGERKKKEGSCLHEYAYYLRHTMLKLAQVDDDSDGDDEETRRGAETKLSWYASLA